jgi:hypothetical protein
MLRKSQVSFIAMFVAVLFLAVSCEQKPKETEETQSEDVELVEKEVVEEPVFDQQEIENEISQMETSSNQPMTRSAAGAGRYNPADDCFRGCESILDNYEGVTASGSTQRAYEDCLKRCQEKEAAANSFYDCIQNAQTEEDKKACREAYMNANKY